MPLKPKVKAVLVRGATAAIAAAVLMFLITMGSYWWVQGAPRTFTVTAAEVSLPRSMATLDNVSKVVRLRAPLGDAGRSLPCWTAASPDAGGADDGGVAATSASAAPAPVPFVATGAGATDAAGPCRLESSAPDRTIELSSAAQPSPFRAIALSAKSKTAGGEPCSVTLRAGMAEQELVDVEWFPARNDCLTHTTITVAPGKPSIEAKGVATPESGVPRFGNPKGPTDIELPLAPERSLAARFRLQGSRVSLWAPDLQLDRLEVVAAAATVFEHRVGEPSVADGRCEAAPGSTVTFSADPDEPFVLKRIDLTTSGLEVSFKASGDFRLDTGSCVLSNASLVNRGVFLTVLAVLSALGISTWIGERLCKFISQLRAP